MDSESVQIIKRIAKETRRHFIGPPWMRTEHQNDVAAYLEQWAKWLESSEGERFRKKVIMDATEQEGC